MKQGVRPQARAGKRDFCTRFCASSVDERSTSPFDYEQKYSEDDEYCMEMGPNARFWRVYLDEGQIHDTELIEGWRDTLDVLLVFVCPSPFFTSSS